MTAIPDSEIYPTNLPKMVEFFYHEKRGDRRILKLLARNIELREKKTTAHGDDTQPEIDLRTLEIDANLEKLLESFIFKEDGTKRSLHELVDEMKKRRQRFVSDRSSLRKAVFTGNFLGRIEKGYYTCLEQALMLYLSLTVYYEHEYAAYLMPYTIPQEKKNVFEKMVDRYGHYNLIAYNKTLDIYYLVFYGSTVVNLNVLVKKKKEIEGNFVTNGSGNKNVWVSKQLEIALTETYLKMAGDHAADQNLNYDLQNFLVVTMTALHQLEKRTNKSATDA